MKVKELETKAKEQVDEARKERAVCALKESQKVVDSARRTLACAEKKHGVLLEKDIEEFDDCEKSCDSAFDPFCF